MSLATATPKDLAKRLLTQLDRDRELLLVIDEYLHGNHDDPYMPDNADEEYQLLAERAITNVCPFIVQTPAQALYVDQYRRGTADVNTDSSSGKTRVERAIAARKTRTAPEWDHWQKSRLDARQKAIYHGAIGYGHAFTVTERLTKGPHKGQVRTKGLSALKTTALFEDPANDDNPYVALTVTKFANTERAGKARMWDESDEYEVTFDSLENPDEVTVKKIGKHGADECPVTRFAAAVDLEGRTVGVIAPMIALQNRLNQTVFDLLVVQSYASFTVRTISGMAPPVKMKPLDAEGNTIDLKLTPDAEIAEWVEELDENGKPIPLPVNLSAKRVFWAEDNDTNFGTLDGTPLDGFISAIELAFRHIASLSQTPPHHLLGQIANLSAEALTAAETALSRRVSEFQAAFGESWERVFRLAATMGDYEGSDDFHGEVIWRDMEQRSLAQAGDALGKLAESLGIPKRGLWARVPGATLNELTLWDDLADEENESANTAAAVRRASATGRPTYRASDQPTEESA